MADNDNMVSSDAEQIKKMASAIRDMSNDMKAFNSEMNATVKLISRMQSQVKSASRTASAESRRRTREEISDEELAKRAHYKFAFQQRRKAEKAALEAEKKAKAARIARTKEIGLARKQHTNKTPEINQELLARVNKRKQEKEKKQNLQEKQIDRAGKVGLGLVVALFRASFKELQKQNAELRKLNQQFGGTTGGNTLYLGKQMQTQASYDTAKKSADLMKSNNNALKFLTDGIKKLYSGIVEYSGTIKETIQITQQQMATIAQLQGSQAGISYGASGQIYHTARSIALMRMRALNPDRSDESLLADEMYQQIYSSLLSAMISGGAVANTGYTTEGWEGWAFENLGWSPNVDYSSEAQADARRRYLEMLANLGNDEKAAEQIKYYKNQSRLLKSIAGQLFSFDEVESQQAISMEDTVESVNKFGEDATSTLRNEENWLADLAKRYGLSAEQIANIRRILTDTDMTMTDIELLLAAGIKFDDSSTASIIEMANSFGLSAKEIIRAYEMYDNDLSKAAAELRKMAERGIDVHVYVNQPLGYEGGGVEDNYYAVGETQANTQLNKLFAELDEQITGQLDKDSAKRWGYLSGIISTASESQAASLLDDLQNVQQKASTGQYTLADYLMEYLISKEFESVTDYNNAHQGPKFDTGGIGTSKVTDATLFENGPEAVIPLSSDIGKTFMADAISAAIGDTNIGGDTINITIAGPVFTESERQLNKWATELGDRYTQIKARRGGK